MSKWAMRAHFRHLHFNNFPMIFFKLMGFDPCNRALKIQESIWNSNSHNGSSFGSVKVHSLTLFAFLGACDVTHGSSSWPETLQPLALVVKVGVTTPFIAKIICPFRFFLFLGTPICNWVILGNCFKFVIMCYYIGAHNHWCPYTQTW
jgi:hypothetical protein